jgi:hypothetical protein
MKGKPTAILTTLLRKAGMPALLCTFICQSAAGMHNRQHTADTVPPQVFTVINVMAGTANKQHVTVVFAQSARFYQLPRKGKHYRASLRLLQQAKKTGQPVKVYLTKAFGDTIAKVVRVRGK